MGKIKNLTNFQFLFESLKIHFLLDPLSFIFIWTSDPNSSRSYDELGLSIF